MGLAGSKIKKECLKCGRLITLCNYDRHFNVCGEQKNQKVSFHLSENWRINEKEYRCPHCENIYSKRGIIGHIWFNHGNGKTQDRHLKGRTAWNKGLTKKDNPALHKMAESISKKIKELKTRGEWKQGVMSEEKRMELSRRQSLFNTGGKAKWYEIAGVKVQGTWERDLALLMNKLNIKWFKIKTNNHIFIYFRNGKMRSYAPDFFIEEIGKYLEVKGFWWMDDKEKMKTICEQRSDLKDSLIIIEKNDYFNILKIKNKEEFLKYLLNINWTV